MKKVSLVARVLLGAIFLLAGLNGLTMVITGKGFVSEPQSTGAMLDVMNGLMAMVYLIPAVSLIETVCGVMLLFGKKMNLILVLLGPIVFNIAGVHLFVDKSGLPLAIAVFVMYGVLLCSRCEDFKSFFSKD